MQQPLVSFIIPAYNAQSGIVRCLESVCGQTYPNLEIIVLNDGSKDETLALCRKLAAQDARIRVVDKPNTGVSDTRNCGLELARGKYIQFADADDYLAPDFTANMVTAAEAQNADLVIAPYWMVYPEDYQFEVSFMEKLQVALHIINPRITVHKGLYGFLPAGVYDQKDYARWLMKKPQTFYFNVLWNKLYRRELLVQGDIRFAKEKFAEDQLFNFEYLAVLHTAVAIEGPGYYYIQNAQGLCHTNVGFLDFNRFRLRMLKRYQELFCTMGIYEELRTLCRKSMRGENEYTLPPLKTEE